MRLRRNFDVTEFFLKYIPEKLTEFGISSEVSGTLLATMKFELERSKASCVLARCFSRRSASTSCSIGVAATTLRVSELY